MDLFLLLFLNKPIDESEFNLLKEPVKPAPKVKIWNTDEVEPGPVRNSVKLYLPAKPVKKKKPVIENDIGATPTTFTYLYNGRHYSRTYYR